MNNMNTELKKNKDNIIKYDKNCFDIYQNSSDKEGYELLIDLLNKNLDREILNNDSLIDVILECYYLLDENNLYEEIIYLDNLLEQKHTEIYNEVSKYIKWWLIDYYLFKWDKEMVEKHLIFFEERPIKTIKQLLPILQKIQFHWYTDLANKLSENVYEEIKNSNKLTEWDKDNFTKTMYYNLLNNTYLDLKNWKSINWDNYRISALKIGYFIKWKFNIYNIDYADFCFNTLKENFTSKTIFIDEKKDIMTKITETWYGFMRHMFNVNKTPFYFSKIIADNIHEFLLPKSEEYMKLEKFYYFSTLDIYKKFWKNLYRLLVNWLDDDWDWLDDDWDWLDDIYWFTLIWGIPYFYEYLLQTKVISKESYDEVIISTNILKNEMKEIFNNKLWKYSFLKKLWELKYNNEDYTDFIESINITSPLSDEFSNNNHCTDKNCFLCNFIKNIDNEECEDVCEDDFWRYNTNNFDENRNNSLLKKKEKERQKKKATKKQKQKLRKRKK